jgi:Tfp pilus assembly protein PilO
MVARGPKNKNSLNLFLNNYFNIIMVFVVIIILAASYFIIIKPKYDATMAAIKINIEQQQKLYTEQYKKLVSLKTVAELYKKVSPTDLKKFNGVLPDNYVKEILFGELEEIITQNGFILDSVMINKPDETKASEEGTIPANTKIGTITFQLSLSAIDYAGFKNLLKLLESNLRLFDITDVSFSPGGNSASLTLSTYYYNK